MTPSADPANRRELDLEPGRRLALPCPFCEGTGIVRTEDHQQLTCFRCLSCAKVWAVDGRIRVN